MKFINYLSDTKFFHALLIVSVFGSMFISIGYGLTLLFFPTNLYKYSFSERMSSGIICMFIITFIVGSLFIIVDDIYLDYKKWENLRNPEGVKGEI